jgi:hypothetical protein
MATYKRIVISRDADNNVDLIEDLGNPGFNEYSALFDDFETLVLDDEIDIDLDEEEENDLDNVHVYLFYPEEKLVCILPDNRVIVNE